MNQSETVKTIFESLAKAQAKFSTLPKDKNGYGYKYTDIDTVISYVRPILSENNLGFMQSLSTVDGKAAITTRLFHSSGEWIEDTTILPDVAMAKTNAAQNMGASITYMRRYFLCAMLGITSDEDTDGADAKKKFSDSDENRTEASAREKAQADGELKELVLTIEGYESDGLIPKEWKPKADLYIKNKDIKGLKGVIDYCKKQSA